MCFFFFPNSTPILFSFYLSLVYHFLSSFARHHQFRQILFLSRQRCYTCFNSISSLASSDFRQYSRICKTPKVYLFLHKILLHNRCMYIFSASLNLIDSLCMPICGSCMVLFYSYPFSLAFFVWLLLWMWQL